MLESALTRRQLVQGLAALFVPAAVPTTARGEGGPVTNRFEATATPQATGIGPYTPDTLPPGIRSRFVHNINGITMHVLEAGYEAGDRPGVLLLHGFPELAFSWRKVML